MYSKSTLLGFPHGIEKWLHAPPLNKDLKLTPDPRFNRSNEILNVSVREKKTWNKTAIENEDLLRLKSSQVLTLSSPLSLLRNMWYHVILFFCPAESVKFEVDPTDHNYATMAHDETTKNHPGRITDVPSTENWVGPTVRNKRERRLQGLEIVHVQIKPEERVVFPIYKIRTGVSTTASATGMKSVQSEWTRSTPWGKSSAKQHPCRSSSPTLASGRQP